MRYHALACDYDGTLALHGVVDSATVEALERLRASGRKLLLVTGRQVDDLLAVFQRTDLFERIVAENGAVMYTPGSHDVEPLAGRPPAELVRELEARLVTPLSVGHVIVATWEPHGETAFEVIRGLGLELHVIFNKGAVMILPSGVNKATGLRRALDDLKLSLHNTVGVGDAENDHAFIAACECGVAVQNAIDSVKARVDLVTASDHGSGVAELIDRMIASDLEELSARRHDLIIGRADDGDDVRLASYGGGILVAGPSGGGKTTIATVLLERLCDAAYQFCVIDPEGDYHEFPGAIALRGRDGEALAEDTLRILDRPSENAIVSLLDLRLDERPPFLESLLPRLLRLRGSTGRPHWILIDEAHHLLPRSWRPSQALPAQWSNVVLVTIHPDHVSSAALDLVDTLIVVGGDPQTTTDAYARGRGGPAVRFPAHEAEDGRPWLLRPDALPVRFTPSEPEVDRLRHRRKYAEGALGPDRSFYFRGPEGRLKLRAQNLEVFNQLASGVDDETWLYHLRRHDVSNWFRTAIKDEELANEAARIEDQTLSPEDSRARIRESIQRRYTTPA